MHFNSYPKALCYGDTLCTLHYLSCNSGQWARGNVAALGGAVEREHREHTTNDWTGNEVDARVVAGVSVVEISESVVGGGAVQPFGDHRGELVFGLLRCHGGAEEFPIVCKMVVSLKFNSVNLVRIVTYSWCRRDEYREEHPPG